jgi:hypothetical protein
MTARGRRMNMADEASRSPIATSSDAIACLALASKRFNQAREAKARAYRRTPGTKTAEAEHANADRYRDEAEAALAMVSDFLTRPVSDELKSEAAEYVAVIRAKKNGNGGIVDGMLENEARAIEDFVRFFRRKGPEPAA